MRRIRFYDSPVVRKAISEMLGREIYFRRIGSNKRGEGGVATFEVETEYGMEGVMEGDWIIMDERGFRVEK